MRVSFIKMHGLGNDFVVLDARDAPLPDLSRQFAMAIADRRTGIGCDQLILLEPDAVADLRMRIFNSDGGEVESCGNAARAVAILLGKPARVATLGGTIELDPCAGGARVSMGTPRFDWERIPIAYAMDTAAMPVSWDGLEDPAAVNVGNPHCVIRADEGSIQDLKEIGLLLNGHAAFPDGVNVGMMHCISRDSIALCVYERGAGMTQACGSGACAAVAVGIQQAWLNKSVSVKQAGGVLQVTWPSPDDRIQLRGPAARVFDGLWQSDTEAKR